MFACVCGSFLFSKIIPFAFHFISIVFVLQGQSEGETNVGNFIYSNVAINKRLFYTAVMRMRIDMEYCESCRNKFIYHQS